MCSGRRRKYPGEDASVETDSTDDDAVSPFRPSHVHETWPYVCASRRSRPYPYVCTWPYFLSCTLAAVRTCTCYVCASTMTRVHLYYDTCPSLLGHGSSLQPADRPIVCTYTFLTRMITLHMLRPGGSRLSGRIRRHFLACEDIAGGSELSAVVTFFPKIQRPFRWVPDVRWRNHYFARNKEAFPCVQPWTQLSASPRTVHFRCMSVVDHVD